MTKRATAVIGSKTTLLLAGLAVAGPLLLANTAAAQQAYYYPQAGSGPVSVNYGALTPYGAPAQPGGFQPYGYVPNTRASAPKSVFTPAAGVPAYNNVPAYGAPAAAYGQPVYGYAAAPSSQPFVAPYANPAFASGYAGLPLSTPTSNAPKSYLNVPGADAQPVALKAPGEAAPAKKKKKKKAAAPAAMAASTPTATEEGAAAQVAAAEAALEAGPAPAAEAPAAEAPAAAAEPIPAPTPPAEPEAVPASVPAPVPTTSVTAAAASEAAPAAEAPAAEAAPATSDATSAAEAPAADAPAEQVASAEAPAETAPDTSGSAVLPAGGTRIVFDGSTDELPQGATGDLDAIAAKMSGDESMKVQVLAYSSGTPDAESQARRKALARGLEVRKYLIGKGIRSNRIDVRALGTKSEGSPADRVDIVPSAG